MGKETSAKQSHLTESTDHMISDPDLKGFELFDQSSLSPAKAPCATLQRDGLISLNTPAYEALGQPQAVLLYYNSDEQTIALVKSAFGKVLSKPVRRQGKNSATWIFSGRLFTRHYGIDTTTARRYEAIVRNGKLFIDLRTGGADATGVRARIKSER